MPILIAESSFITAQSIGATLEDAGYTVVLACGTDQAMRAVAEKRPRLAIVDLALRNGLTGPQLVRALSALGVPVVIYTAYDEASAMEMLEGAAVAAVLCKPAPSDELLATVRSALPNLT